MSDGRHSAGVPPPDPAVFPRLLHQGDTVRTGSDGDRAAATDAVVAALVNGRDAGALEAATRVEVATMATRAAEEALGPAFRALNPLARRDLITAVVHRIRPTVPPPPPPEREQASAAGDAPAVTALIEVPAPAPRRIPKAVEEAHPKVLPSIMEQIDFSTAVTLPRAALSDQLTGIVADILTEQKLQLNQRERRILVTVLLDEMLGLGPLEPLLADDDITDIMVNGHAQIYVERFGKLELTDVMFRDDQHVMNVAMRIVSQIGRRVDEATPLVDARLADGSRVNIIIPPLAIDGPSISIRKFAKRKITLDVMQSSGNLTAAMVAVLRIAARARLNILISGGTGSGKTTLLNALSQMIGHGERVVTIEDAAELQLQQPHVVRLETRPPSLEGGGQVTMRDLVRNALRMRPDRIIIGEIREAEAIDMLQAMNTGHEGSMCTIHANRPREALTRLENMVSMARLNLPARAVRTQIAAAIDLIVQVSRMRDGVRRITHIVETVGMEGDVITTQDLFTFRYEGEDSAGGIRGRYEYSGLRPHMHAKAEFHGLDRALAEALR